MGAAFMWLALCVFSALAVAENIGNFQELPNGAGSGLLQGSRMSNEDALSPPPASLTNITNISFALDFSQSLFNNSGCGPYCVFCDEQKICSRCGHSKVSPPFCPHTPFPLWGGFMLTLLTCVCMSFCQRSCMALSFEDFHIFGFCWCLGKWLFQSAVCAC
jgi:hypothetical protein